MSAESASHAPLLGHNLVRLLYLDEAGTDRDAPWLCVAGVLVHGDRQWPEVDRRIIAIIDKYIPPADRAGFVFHATDIYHGSGYFDRRKPEWSDQSRRVEILNDLAVIIAELSLPVVAGSYEKDQFGLGNLPTDMKVHEKGLLIHNAAATDCLMWADRWIADNASPELATVVHEDGTPAKRQIKEVVRVLRSDAALDEQGLANMKKDLGLPLRHIIDTVHFAEKPDARPLQIADLCAFTIGRVLKGRSVPPLVYAAIREHVKWIAEVLAVNPHLSEWRSAASGDVAE